MDTEIKGMHFYMSVMANARNVWSCGNLVVRQAVRERQVWSKPAIQGQIPE